MSGVGGGRKRRVPVPEMGWLAREGPLEVEGRCFTKLGPEEVDGWGDTGRRCEIRT